MSGHDPYPTHDTGGISYPWSFRCWLGLHAMKHAAVFGFSQPYADKIHGHECQRCGRREIRAAGEMQLFMSLDKQTFDMHARAQRWALREQ